MSIIKEQLHPKGTPTDIIYPETSPDQVVGLDDLLDGKADSSSTYDKSTIDNKLTLINYNIQNKADKNTTYTKTDADNKLALKADKSNTYTKDDVDDELTLKADKSDTYTKDDVDDELALKADKSDTYTKDDVDDELALKADKSDTYTKDDIDNIITGISKNYQFIKEYSGEQIEDVTAFADSLGGDYKSLLFVFSSGSISAQTGNLTVSLYKTTTPPESEWVDRIFYTSYLHMNTGFVNYMEVGAKDGIYFYELNQTSQSSGNTSIIKGVKSEGSSISIPTVWDSSNPIKSFKFNLNGDVTFTTGTVIKVYGIPA